jgi:hypothetical protein
VIQQVLHGDDPAERPSQQMEAPQSKRPGQRVEIVAIVAHASRRVRRQRLGRSIAAQIGRDDVILRQRRHQLLEESSRRHIAMDQQQRLAIGGATLIDVLGQTWGAHQARTDSGKKRIL